MHLTDQSATASLRRNEQPSPEIALIGSKSSFSDNLVRATGQHLRGLTMVHIPTLRDFHALPQQQFRLLRLMVIEDAAFLNASDDELRDLSYPAACAMALAYANEDAASGIYHAVNKALPIESYVPLDVRLDVWLSILRLLLHGGKYVPEDLLARPGRNHEPNHHPEASCGLHLGLTPRQHDVLKLVANGLPNKVIATRLGVSDHTVKQHIHNIIGKLGVANRTEAAARFRDLPM